MKFKHQFVEFIPSDLEEGTLYISMEYGTASHLCACGCGEKIVTPFGKGLWKLIYNGDYVSLKPSIGNWSYPCRSHYWITRGRIQWAEDWGHEKVSTLRQNNTEESADIEEIEKKKSLWDWIIELIKI